jgi:hypothetical protein
MIRTLFNRAPRYKVKDQTKVAVTLEKADGSSAQLIAELLDISIGGAKFWTSETMAIRQIVDVVIGFRETGYQIQVSGEICWANPAPGDGWLLGCSFKPALPEDVLQLCATSGIIERRRHPREPVSIPASARWELDRELVPARVLNYSPGGGFCLLSQTDDKPGERVLLELTRGDGQVVTVRGKSRWQAPAADGYVVGCEFLSTEDASNFADVVQSLCQVDGGGRSRRLTAVSSVVAAASIAGLTIYIWFGQAPPSVPPAPRVSATTAADFSLTETAETALVHSEPADAFVEPPSESTSAEGNPSTAPVTQDVAAALQVYREGLSHYRTREYQRAADCFAQAAALDTGKSKYLFSLAVSQYQLGDHEEAERTLRQGVALEVKSSATVDAATSKRAYRDPAQAWFEESRERLRSELGCSRD